MSRYTQLKQKDTNILSGIGNTISNVASAIGNFGKTILQAPGRASSAITLDTRGELQFTPTTPIEKFFLGDQPIKSASQQYKEAKQTLESGGLIPKNLSSPVAGVAVFGGLALDLIPFGGTEENAAKALVKTKTVEEALTTLTRLGVADDIARAYADDVVKVITEKEAKNILKAISKLQETTKIVKPISNIIKNAEDFKPLLNEAKSATTLDDFIKSVKSRTPENLGIGKSASRLFGNVNSNEEAEQLLKTIYTEAKQEDSLTKLINAIGEAKPIRQESEALYTAERERRAIIGTKALETTGEKGFQKALGKLKGELPKPKFEGVKLEQFDIDNLTNIIKNNKNLDFYDKISTYNGLTKIIGETGSIPTEGELKFLKDTFGEELIKVVLDKRPWTTKFGENLAETLNIARALQSSIDMSAPFRQGLILTVSKPKQSIPAFKNMFKYFASEKVLDTLGETIKAKPLFGLMKRSGLAFTDTTKTAIGLTKKEEAFMSNFAEKIPIIGTLVKAGERAYVGFLNKLRADVFEDIAQNFIKSGIDTQKHPEVFNSLAEFINTATGRGNLGRLNNAAPVLNGILYSPRLMASRINMLNPLWYFKQAPQVRREAIKSMITTTGVGLTMLGLAKMGGAKVEDSPISSDFGKIRLGNTRLDIWGGFQQWVRLTAQMITGEMKSTNTGKISKLSNKEYPFTTKLDQAVNFFIGKFAPIPSLAIDLMRGTNAVGEDIGLKQESFDKLTPLYIQDLIDAFKEEGIESVLTVGVPAFFGVGTQTYTTKSQKIKTKSRYK
jgi:hypothetical protein